MYFDKNCGSYRSKSVTRKRLLERQDFFLKKGLYSSEKETIGHSYLVLSSMTDLGEQIRSVHNVL